MQRISDGLAVPKDMLDTFTRKTSNGAGVITCELTYTPQSIGHIDITSNRIGLEQRVYVPTVLTGRSLEMTVYQHKYSKVVNVTGTANSGGSGADPHSHAINSAAANTVLGNVGLEAQPDILVHYKVA